MCSQKDKVGSEDKMGYDGKRVTVVTLRVRVLSKTGDRLTIAQIYTFQV
jgi:hypothetical protein